jgi:GNAT superfamily N-acetyltransferase
MVERATVADIETWLALAREVEPLFGPMPRFDVTLKSKIAEGLAICARDSSGHVIGGALLGGEAPDNWIRWLAVARSARRNGVGGALMLEILRRWPGPCTISLATFGADNIEGLPARRFYERFGFAPGPMLPPGPEGGTRQRYTLVQP